MTLFPQLSLQFALTGEGDVFENPDAPENQAEGFEDIILGFEELIGEIEELEKGEKKN